MVDQKEYYLKSVDRLSLFARSWSNQREPKGLVIMIPGLGDHSGRFDNWARLFVENGFAVTSFDLRGNGRSQGKRGHARSYKDLINDIDIFFKESVTRFPNIPVFIYGHSLGGNLAINYIIQRKPSIYGLITTSPWFKLNIEPGQLMMFTGKLLYHIVPSFTVSSGLSREDFNGDIPVNNHINEDPLLHNRISIRLYLEAMKNGIWSLKNIYKINVPFLIMYGKDDMISSYKVCEEYISNTSEKTKLVLWEGCRHNLHNAPSSLTIHQSIVKWIEDKYLSPDKIFSVNEFVPHRS